MNTTADLPAAAVGTSHADRSERRSAIPGLRLTASDRAGQAQPVPERDVPDRPWLAIVAAAALIALLLSAAWELQMRRLGLVPGDLGDSPSHWAEQRKRLGASPKEVAIVGDSRVLFGTDLDRFQAVTGVRPVQLALAGTNGRPFLEQIAADPQFRGLVIVGINEVSYFRDGIGRMGAALDHAKWESPADRGGFLLRRALRRELAMLDEDYRLSVLVARLDPGWRAGVDGPWLDVWKVAQFGDDRQTWLWPRLEHDVRLRDHARLVWRNPDGKLISPAAIASTIARTEAAVAAIRARGGEVVFLRPPSVPPVRQDEERRLPRAKGWEALLAAVPVQGLHADDMLPAVQQLTLPEWSHLSRACATVFTDAYVRALAALTPRLPIRPDAPPALTRADCPPPDPP